MVHLAIDTELPPLVVIYLNRLSDLLFMLARVANKRAGAGEVTFRSTSMDQLLMQQMANKEDGAIPLDVLDPSTIPAASESTPSQ